MALTGAQLSFHASIQSLFCSASSPEPGTGVKDFTLFSSSSTVCFEEHSCGSCQAPFQGEKIQVALFPLSLPNVHIPADTTVVSQEGALAGGHGLCTLAIVTWHWAYNSQGRTNSHGFHWETQQAHFLLMTVC